MDKTASVLEPPSVNRARTAYKYIRLTEKAVLNLALRVRAPIPSTMSPAPSKNACGQGGTSSSRDTWTAGWSTGLPNVNGGEMTSREVTLEPASNSPRNDLSITFVPCGYLHCTQCYEFPAPGNPNIARPRPNGFGSQLNASDVAESDMSSEESDCFKECDYYDGGSDAEGHKDTGGRSEFTGLAGNGTPCIGKVVQGNLIGAGRDRGHHEVDGMDVVSNGECGSNSASTLSDASTPSSSGDEYVPPQTATTRKARRTAAARSGKRWGKRR